MFVYRSFISGGISILGVAAAGDDNFLIFPFRDTKLGPKIYSATMMLSLVTSQFGSWFPLIIINWSCSEGHPIMF